MIKMLIQETSSPEDLATCADIWLESSLTAHSFISADFWRKNYEAMACRYLPASRVLLALADKEAAGFAAVKDGELAALFVRPAFQKRGLGFALLQKALSMEKNLRLTVYAKNHQAINFYSRHGFAKGAQSVCPLTGEAEMEMHKKAPAASGEG